MANKAKETAKAKKSPGKHKESPPVDFSKPLKNWQYEQFCRAHLVTNNATQAAKDAKYSPKTAGSKGTHLLQIVNIAGRLAFLRSQLAQKLDITAERVINEYAKLAFSNTQDFLDEDNAIKDISQLPREIAAAVSSVQVETRHDNGDSEGYTEKVKFTLHSKIQALDALGKNLGIFKEDNDQSRSQIAVQIVNYAGASKR